MGILYYRVIPGFDFIDCACFVEACILCYEGMFLSFLPKGLVQRFAATRRWGFLALNFIRITELGYSTSLSLKHETPTCV